MNWKLKFINASLKLLKPLSKIYNSVKNVLPKRRSNETEELRAEIEELKKDLKKHQKKISDLGSEAIEKIKPKTEYIQSEMYTSVVNSGEQGSESGGYILLNLPVEEYKNVKSDFNNMKTAELKNLLGLDQNKIIKNVSHGESYSEIKKRFVEINGTRHEFTKEQIARLF